MCFCEEDECNSATKTGLASLLLFLPVLALANQMGATKTGASLLLSLPFLALAFYTR